MRNDRLADVPRRRGIRRRRRPDAVATNLTAGTLEFFHGVGDGTFTRGGSFATARPPTGSRSAT